MSDKPSYLGLLNAVALAEGNAACYLNEWADVTKDAEVRKVILTVAAREAEHAAAFTKRINELGFELLPKDDPELPGKIDLVKSDCSDLEKLEALGLGKESASRPTSSTASSGTIGSTSAPASCSAATSPRSATPAASFAGATPACATRPTPRRRPRRSQGRRQSDPGHRQAALHPRGQS